MKETENVCEGCNCYTCKSNWTTCDPCDEYSEYINDCEDVISD